MQVPGTTVPWYQYRSMEPYRRYQQVPLTGDSYRIVYMKIFLRAPASPRAARPPRPTSVPIKHRNRKKPNFIIIFRPAAAARPLRLRLAPGSPKEIRAPALPPPAYLGKPHATVTALYRSQAQARLIFTALPQLRCPYLNHIQVVRCGRRRYVLHPSSIGNYIAHR